ncbi:MAG: TylF/MycF/NovP-related O-methyltransferase [Bryobacteraceae bacterium]
MASSQADLSWNSFNDFLFHGEVDRFTKLLARYELYKRVIDLPGDIVEGGVFKGAGVLYWARLAQIFNPLSLRRIIGFDTFGGYPGSTSRDHDKEAGEKFLTGANYTGGSPSEILEKASALGLSQRIELIEGDSTKTIGEYARNNPGFRIAILNLDFDIYEPTAAALEALYPLIVPNGIIVFDEYASRGWGESDAIDAFFKDKHVVYHSIPWALSPTAFVCKAA